MADDVMKINPDDLTIGDLEDFEDIVGKSFAAATSGGEVDAKALKALIFIVKRKDNPDFTLDDARSVKLGELQIGEDKPDPTDAAS